MDISATLRKKAQPWRGGPIAAPSVDIKKVGARLREVRALEALQPRFASLKVTIDSPFRAALQKRVDGPIEQLTEMVPEVEAAMLCLLGANDQAWDRAHEIGADMVHLWCSRGSVAQATRALLLNVEYNDEGKRSREQKFQAFFPYVGPWRALRGYLSQASEADYQEALAVARELAWDQVRWLAAHAFASETDLVGEAVEEVLSRPRALRAIGLLAAAGSGEQFARLAEHLKDYLGNDYIGIKVGDFLPASVARLGNDSFEGLKILAESATKVGDKKMLAELLCELTHPEVGPWLSARLKDKAFGPAAHAYQAKSDGVVAAATAAPAADEPWILRQPPWEKRAPKSKPLQVQLEMPPAIEVVHFAPGRREYILENIKTRSASSSKGWVDYYQSKPKGQFFPEELCELHDRDWALQQWNESSAVRWNPYSLRSTYWLTVPERLLAVFGTAALPGLLTTLSVAPDVTYAGLSLVESPRLAPLWAEAWVTKKKFRKLAGSWFMRFPRAAALGLLAPALGPAGKLRGFCETLIRWMNGKGLGDALREVAREVGAVQGLDSILAYDALQELPAKMPALPGWFRPDQAQAPTHQGKPLSVGAMSNLALMVAISTLEAPYAGLQNLDCDPASLERFAASVYQRWLKAGGPPKEDWGFKILAYFGGDEVARKLAPDLRKWPGEGLSARASVGLDILRYLGSDVALTHLHGIALKVRFKALQDKAQQHIQEIAEERGLSVDELADRLVPDLDLEADGSRPLGDYRVTFDELLRPRLRDQARRVLPDLPKNSPAPVAELWKALKKDAKAVASVQLERLEQALTGRRRWSAEVFRALLVEHPLLIHLVRRLVWGVYAEDKLLHTFRVAEDLSYATVADEAVQVEGTVGLFHPLEDPEQVAAWKTVFQDYQILQPFAQLERSLHRLPEGQVGLELSTFQGLQLAGGHLLSLENRGWHRGQIESGCLLEMTRGSLRLELDEGLPVEDIAGSTVTLGKVHCDTPFEQLHPITVSEMLRDLESLSTKALQPTP
jgi:hypothetical protein